MAWKEILPSRDASGDGQVVTTDRKFRVWDVTKAAILLTPGDILGGPDGVTPLPAPGDPHPDYAGLGGPVPKLDSYDVRGVPGSATLWEATARYSPDGRFRLGRPVVLPDEFLHYGGSSGAIEVEIPFARREYSYRAPEAGQPPHLPTGFWARDAIVVTSPLARRTAKVRVPGFAFGPQPHTVRNAIDREVNRIHKLEFADGSDIHAEFLGWQHEQVEADLFQLTYQWAIDGGTPLIAFGQGPPGVEEQSGLTYYRERYPVKGFDGIPIGGFESYDGIGGFLRPPFHALILTLPADRDQTPIWFPQPIAFAGTPAQRAAWKSFPGLA